MDKNSTAGKAAAGSAQPTPRTDPKADPKANPNPNQQNPANPANPTNPAANPDPNQPPTDAAGQNNNEPPKPKEVPKKIFKPFDSIKEVTADHIISFCFPKRFPSKKNESGLRLFLIEKNISRLSLQKDGEVAILSGNTQFPQPIAYFPLKAMLKEARNEFIEGVFGLVSVDHTPKTLKNGSTLSTLKMAMQKTEISAKADEKELARMYFDKNTFLDSVLEFKKQEIIDLFQKPPFPKPENQTKNRYYQDIIQWKREKMIKELHQTVPNLSKIRNPPQFDPKKHDSVFPLQNLSEVKTIQHRLHKFSFQISNLGEKSLIKETSQNVKIIRDL